MTRRQFITYTGIAGAALVVGGAGGAVLTRIFPGGQTQILTSYPHIRIAHLSDLQGGKTIVFDYPIEFLFLHQQPRNTTHPANTAS